LASRKGGLIINYKLVPVVNNARSGQRLAEP
jgi:hypothetical protein